MVGMPCTPYFIAHSGFSSVFTFATSTLPAFSLAIFSNAGATILHGPHQGAQKSTITGTVDFNTVFSNAESVTCTGSLIIYNSPNKFDKLDARHLHKLHLLPINLQPSREIA